MSDTTPQAAIEAANEITLRVQTKRGDCESAVTRIDKLAEVCADFIRFNEDALLSLPTPVPTTQTAAEVAGIASPVRPCSGIVGRVMDADGKLLSGYAIAAALNAPAPAPVAGDGGLFGGGGGGSLTINLPEPSNITSFTTALMWRCSSQPARKSMIGAMGVG